MRTPAAQRPTGRGAARTAARMATPAEWGGGERVRGRRRRGRRGGTGGGEEEEGEGKKG